MLVAYKAQKPAIDQHLLENSSQRSMKHYGLRKI